MSLCVVASGSTLTATSTAPGSCVDYLLMSVSEFNSIAPVYTIADVAEMAAGVVAVWAFAWSIKALRRSL